MTSCLVPSSGAFDGSVHRQFLRVYYDDTDAGGIVYHTNYLRWFERARSDMLILLGIDQRAALETGQGAYAVAELAMRYFAPARLGDIVLVRSRVEHVGAASVRMQQSGWRDDIKLAEASLKIGFVGPDGRPRRQPEAWRLSFAGLIKDDER